MIFFNLIIQSIQISFLDQCMSAFVATQSTKADASYQGYALFAALFGYNIFLTVFITCKQNELRKK